MGKEHSLTAEKAGGSHGNPLRTAIVKFERAPQGTRKQTIAFEWILRALASHDAKSKSTKAEQNPRQLAGYRPMRAKEGVARGNARTNHG